ncbi:hypothetical protein J2T03_001648 [Chryseobacterium lathyri]|nr:hypothetical protein [Chryseobacterium lathyri]
MLFSYIGSTIYYNANDIERRMRKDVKTNDIMGKVSHLKKTAPAVFF